MLPCLIPTEYSLKTSFPLASDLKPGVHGSKTDTAALLTYRFVIDEGGVWGNLLGGHQGRVLCRIVATTVIILQPRGEKTHQVRARWRAGRSAQEQRKPSSEAVVTPSRETLHMGQVKAQILRTHPVTQAPPLRRTDGYFLGRGGKQKRSLLLQFTPRSLGCSPG